MHRIYSESFGRTNWDGGGSDANLVFDLWCSARGCDQQLRFEAAECSDAADVERHHGNGAACSATPYQHDVPDDDRPGDDTGLDIGYE